MEIGAWRVEIVAENKRNYSEGYWLVKPQLGKLTVTNLVNFAEAEGAYGVASTGIVRLGKSALFFGLYIVLCLVLSVIVKNWFVSLLLWILLFPLPFRLISLFVFNERKVKRDYKLREELKSKTATSLFSNFFGIYDIDEVFPYTCYMLDGSIGLFIRCVRRTQVGNVQEKAFYHGQGLASFYNQCAALGIKPELIDLQSANSYDERFNDLYNHLNEVSSPTMQKVLSSMYHHWEDNSSSSQLTHEYFLLRGTGDPMVFWDKVTSLTSALMNASYKRISVMDKDQIATLTKDLYGLVEFPIADAMNQAVQRSSRSSLRLLWLGDAQNRRKRINPSLTELRIKQEEELRRRELEQRRAQQTGASGVSGGQAQPSVGKGKAKAKGKSEVVKPTKPTAPEVLDLFGSSDGKSKQAAGLTGLLEVKESATSLTKPRVEAKQEDADLYDMLFQGSKPKGSEKQKVDGSEELNLFE